MPNDSNLAKIAHAKQPVTKKYDGSAACLVTTETIFFLLLWHVDELDKERTAKLC